MYTEEEINKELEALDAFFMQDTSQDESQGEQQDESAEEQPQDTVETDEDVDDEGDEDKEETEEESESTESKQNEASAAKESEKEDPTPATDTKTSEKAEEQKAEQKTPTPKTDEAVRLKQFERLIADLNADAQDEGFRDIYDKLAHSKDLSTEDYKRMLAEAEEDEGQADTEEKSEETAKAETQTAEQTPTDEAKEQAKAAVLKADLELIYAIDPQAKDEFTDIFQMENAREFCRLRFLGASVEEAYRAARKETLEKRAKAKKEATNPSQATDNKSHFKTATAANRGANSVSMSREELLIAKEFFGDMPNAELEKLYRKVR